MIYKNYCLKAVFITGFTILIFLPCSAQMQVEDKNNRRQVERMVYKRWNQFTPRHHFLLLYNRYMRGDKRNILQLAPTAAAVKINRNKTEEESKDMDDVHEYNVAQQLNIEAESHYHLHYKKVFNNLDDMFLKIINECFAQQVSFSDIQAFEDEKSMLYNYLQAVRNGNIPPGESSEAMKEIKIDYEKLIAVMNETLKCYKVINKYKKTIKP